MAFESTENRKDKVKMKVKFDSWDEDFKSVFGAIQAGTTVKWCLEFDQDVREVTLWLIKSGEEPVAYPMGINTQTQRYETEVRVGTSGIYYYYFAFKVDNQMRFVEQGRFGQGVLTDNGQNINSFQLTCYDYDAPEVDWYQKGTAYQIFPDRFANGNPHGEIYGKKKNSFIYATDEDVPYYIKNSRGEIVRWDFFGGNLEGIRQKIPYFKKLGINIIYLNPIFLSSSNHRYDTIDYFKIDPMLGDEEDLNNLLTDLHKNKIRLILDGVFNHAGQDSIYFQAAINNPDSRYKSWFNFINYPEKYQSWWGVSTLPEFNKSNPEYQNLIYGKKGVLDKWTTFDIDGWRLDVADELPMPFLRNIRSRLAKDNCSVLIGEVWEDASNKYVNSEYRPYITGDNLTGVMNYPIRNFIVNLLTADNYERETQVFDNISRIIEHYPTSFLKNCLNNVGTHDTARIKTVLGQNEYLVSLAFGLLFMLPGVPCIYYGDEAGLIGDSDPDNRRFFPWDNISTFLPNRIRNWIDFRKNNSVLIDGKIGFFQAEFGVSGIIRYDDKNIFIYLINKNEYDLKLNKDHIKFYCLPKDVQSQVLSELNQIEINHFSDYQKNIKRINN